MPNQSNARRKKEPQSPSPTELAERVLQLEDGDLVEFCQYLIHRDRLLRKTAGDYGLFAYDDLYEEAPFPPLLLGEKLKVMRDHPSYFVHLYHSEGRLVEEVYEGKDKLQKRNRQSSGASNSMYLHVCELRFRQRKKWEQVLETVSKPL
jgi:hypothetical protein